MDGVHATAAHPGIGAVRVPSSISAERFYAALCHQKILDKFHGAERTIVVENIAQGLAHPIFGITQ